MTALRGAVVTSLFSTRTAEYRSHGGKRLSSFQCFASLCALSFVVYVRLRLCTTSSKSPKRRHSLSSTTFSMAFAKCVCLHCLVALRDRRGRSSLFNRGHRVSLSLEVQSLDREFLPNRDVPNTAWIPKWLLLLCRPCRCVFR